MYQLSKEQRQHMINKLANMAEDWSKEDLLSYVYCREYSHFESKTDEEIITAYIRMMLKEEVNL